MEKFKVSFEANNQQLKSHGTKHASDTYADIEATFVLGSRWTDMDSVSAVWWNDFTRIATVLDSDGKCIVPHEVLTRKGYVRVNLVGSVVENGELVTRLTSYSAEAVKVNEKIKLTGSETSELTPSQFEQFVTEVKADADRAETVRDEAEAARDVAVSAKDTAVNAVEGFEDIVDTATATAVQTIQGEGATQVTAIQTEGTTQVASVRTEGSTQVTAVQDKGDEVLDSIPADYTQLSQNVTDLKSDLDYVYDTYADAIGFAENYFDPREIVVTNTNNWTLESKTMSGFKVTHNNTYSGGAPYLSVSLPAGRYVFHADFTNSTKKTITLYKGGVYSAEMNDGWIFSLTETTTCEFIFSPASTGTFEVTNISVTDTTHKNYIEQLSEKAPIYLSGASKPIIITSNRTIIFPKTVYITQSGNNYVVQMNDRFEFDFSGNGNYTLKTVYFDTSKLADAVANGLSDSCFYVRERQASLPIDPKYVLIAVIPDAFQQNNAKPYATFDFITTIDEARPNYNAKGFIGSVTEVTALKGAGAIVDATAYDQFDTYIALWDALLQRANQYGTYMQKCWIDGTAYDDTQKIMSSLPTSGEHNPRGDMNRYPLIMYKMTPSLYGESFLDHPTTKKILIVSGIHGGSSGGDHIESPVAIYYFAKRIVEEFYLNDSLANIRNNYEIDIVPIANPWGINNLQRVNEQGIDINRDFQTFATVSAQKIKDLIDTDTYDLYLDSHCLGGLSLVEGDLADAPFVFITDLPVARSLGKQLLNFIGAKYSSNTNLMYLVISSSAWYADRHGQSKGLVSISTEIPANAPLYYGDTVGDPHGELAVKEGVDYVQNVLSVFCEFIQKMNK